MCLKGEASTDLPKPIQCTIIDRKYVPPPARVGGWRGGMGVAFFLSTIILYVVRCSDEKLEVIVEIN